jgi:hypothetical protein
MPSEVKLESEAARLAKSPPDEGSRDEGVAEFL